MTSTIGLLHPGEMGCAIGAELVRAGHRVLWASADRGPATAARAAAAGLLDVGTVAELSAGSSVILSVCPPAAARATAESVAGFTGIYVDANAIAPDTTRELAGLLAPRGIRFVDGGIIGRPPTQLGDVRLYLSGEPAAEVAELFAGTVVSVPVLGPRIGAASAIKLAYAAWTKGTMALLIAAHDFAVAEQVADDLRREWAESIPQLAGQHAAATAAAEAKGWRWVGEMQEIAAAFTDAGLPGGFHQAAAAIFGRSA